MPFKTVDSAVRGMVKTLFDVASVYSDSRIIILRRLPGSLVFGDGKTISKKTVVTYVSKLKKLCSEGLASPCPIRIRYDRGVIVEIEQPWRYVKNKQPDRISDAEKKAIYEHRKKIRYKLREMLGGLVNSLDAVDALSYVVSRARYVDEPLFPVTIEEVGLAGSAWRRIDPGDIDIVVSTRPNSLIEQHEEFHRILNDKLPHIWDMIQELRARYHRINMEFFIETYKEQLRDLGLTDRHLEWLRYLRIKEFNRAAYIGVVSTDYRNIVARFLRGGWSRIRLNIHFKEEQYRYEIPYIPIWRRNTGFLQVTQQQVQELYNKERLLLKKELERTMNILKTIAEQEDKDETTRCLAQIAKTIINRLEKHMKMNTTEDLNTISRLTKYTILLEEIKYEHSIKYMIKKLWNLYNKGLYKEITQDIINLFITKCLT